MLLAGLFLAAVPLVSPFASTQTLEGDWEYVTEGSADIAATIEGTVSKMAFFKRPIARTRLKKTNAAYRRITIQRAADQIVIRFDGAKPVPMPASGDRVKWAREDGETFDVSGKWHDSSVIQSFAAPDGERLNTFRLVGDGDALSLEVKLISEQLPGPVTYMLMYRRAR
jgi:hypothetical protein